MSCKYCRHESLAYQVSIDDERRVRYDRVAEPIPYDDCNINAEPVISWWVDPKSLDWAGHLPRLCIGACDRDGNEEGVSIPIRYCPICGRKLPKTGSEMQE